MLHPVKDEDGEINDIDADFPSRYKHMAIHKVCNRKECDVNWIKIPDTNDQCCWHCVDCGKLKVAKNQYECIDCVPGNRSLIINGTSVKCVPIEEVFGVS